MAEKTRTKHTRVICPLATDNSNSWLPTEQAKLCAPRVNDRNSAVRSLSMFDDHVRYATTATTTTVITVFVCNNSCWWGCVVVCVRCCEQTGFVVSLQLLLSSVSLLLRWNVAKQLAACSCCQAVHCKQWIANGVAKHKQAVLFWVIHELYCFFKNK